MNIPLGPLKLSIQPWKRKAALIHTLWTVWKLKFSFQLSESSDFSNFPKPDLQDSCFPPKRCAECLNSTFLTFLHPPSQRSLLWTPHWWQSALRRRQRRDRRGVIEIWWTIVTDSVLSGWYSTGKSKYCAEMSICYELQVKWILPFCFLSLQYVKHNPIVTQPLKRCPLLEKIWLETLRLLLFVPIFHP